MKINYEISPHLRDLTHAQVTYLDKAATDGTSWEFYCSSYIHHPTVFGNKMSGMVQDAIDEYFAEVRVNHEELVAGCSCRSPEGICKHAIALLYGWVNDREGFLNVADALERLRKRDKDDILAILGRILMFDPRNAILLEEKFAVDDLEEDVL
jgi:hypothetical protein